ncbi:MAG: di-trans,poly-cis-decaprenylcistransferase, partial [Dehalococcoidia bacterium]|nr:di-trans,poly-cis-decaprenylcistransferase [Dehalococcoidia bacterium]
HVAIIMDGNGRWARKRRLPRTAGHQRGGDRIHPVALACARRGIEYLTVYAFSTENWTRPSAEVAALLHLLSTKIGSVARACLRDNLRLRLLGRLDGLSPESQEKVRGAVEMNVGNTGLTLCIAFDYGTRSEVVRAARQLVSRGVAPDAIDEELVSANLYTAGMPDVDLLIRCGGESRLSNFLMWQSAYAELYFTEVLWPDFGATDVDDALAEYARRNRRFGAIHDGASSQ